MLLVIVMVCCLALLWQLRRWRRAARSDYIRRYPFPNGLLDKLQRRRPELMRKDCELVSRALRHYFLAYLHGGCRFVSMPSQLADDLWHEFILYTRHYELFCRKAFGGFFHHTPAVVLSKNRQNNSGLRRVWWHCCREESIDPKKPSRLPLLFALDGKLGIKDGFVYAADCRGPINRNQGGNNTGPVYCGGDFSSADFDGCTEGFGDGYGDSGGEADAGCGGGCGGD